MLPRNRVRTLVFHRAVIAVLMAALVLSAFQARGEWMAVTTGTEPLTVYVDPETVTRAENHVTVWQLLDFKITQTVGGKPYLSVKLRNEFDCGGKKTRILEMTHFSGNLGSGKVIATHATSQQWVPISPDTLALTVLTQLCEEH